MMEIRKFFNKLSRRALIGSVAAAVLVFLAASFGGAYLYWKNLVVKSGTNLKIGAVTDFEYANRRRIGNKLSQQAIPELEKVAEYYNNEFHPELVVEVGDMIESSTTHKFESAKSRFDEINAVFSKIEAQREYVMGNHDLRAVNKEEFRSLAGMEDNHKHFDLGDWRFVIMDTNFNNNGEDRGPSFYVEGYVPEKEFLWLEEALDTERPTIIFSHHPIFPFKDKNVLNGDKVVEFFKKFGNIMLVVSGHDPNFGFEELNGITYLVVDNLANVDSVGSFATLEAKYNRYTKKADILIEHYGPTRKSLQIGKDLNGDSWAADIKDALGINS